MLIVLCVGTATDVGKTWVGAATLAALRTDGVVVAARKPVQSFAPDDPGPTDAEVLAAATGEPVELVCPPHRNHALAMAPPIAAALLDAEGWLIANLAEELIASAPVADDEDEDEGCALFWVETVGGPLSPIADDGDSADLARWLHPDVVVLVADAGLGTINAVRLSVIPFAARPVIVVLNRYDDDDPLHRANRIWLEREGFDVEVSPEALAARLIADD